MSYVHVMEGRYPEPEEIENYLKKPENEEALRNLTYLCTHANADNWADVEKELRQIAPSSCLENINWDSAERRENAEKLRRRFEENGGMIEL